MPPHIGIMYLQVYQRLQMCPLPCELVASNMLKTPCNRHSLLGLMGVISLKTTTQSDSYGALM